MEITRNTLVKDVDENQNQRLDILEPEIQALKDKDVSLQSKITSLESDVTTLKNVEIVTPTLLNGFTVYGGAYTVTIRKSGNVVNITGGLSPNANASAISSNNGVIAFEIPLNMRPNGQTNNVHHGSGKNYWLSQIDVNGTFSVSRYNGTAIAGDWLTFNVTYIVD